ncbi:hypothetical protein WOLCODRAFT_151943 [Wolfiporia cocos MD-104 SS10]|uniref:Uncharacterized protein n=1 Tax=Wolfiporia cocos (strain MD-104) TaxID=742152 RepID=A0A2H3JSU4_WOLCO|nr:hypothetical protein WOLCODRAFT_151943 [Wolfiporia cocos MD-104 SS10]
MAAQQPSPKIPVPDEVGTSEVRSQEAKNLLSQHEQVLRELLEYWRNRKVAEATNQSDKQVLPKSEPAEVAGPSGNIQVEEPRSANDWRSEHTKPEQSASLREQALCSEIETLKSLLAEQQ